MWAKSTGITMWIIIYVDYKSVDIGLLATGLCGLYIHVDYMSIWTIDLCGLQICGHRSVSYRSLWIIHPCGLHVYLDYRSMWTIGLCGPYFYMDC